MKLKLKKVDKKTLESIKKKNPLEIYTGIIEDVNKINEIKFFIEELTNELSNSNFTTSQNNFNMLTNIFDHYLIKNTKEITENLRSFLLEKIQTLKNILMDTLDAEEAETKIILHFLFKIIRYHDNNKFSLEVNKEVIYKLLLTDDLCEPQIILYLIKIILTNSKYISNLLITLKDELTKEENKITNQSTFYNVYNFIISIPVIDNSIKLINDQEEITNFKLGK